MKLKTFVAFLSTLFFFNGLTFLHAQEFGYYQDPTYDYWGSDFDQSVYFGPQLYSYGRDSHYTCSGSTLTGARGGIETFHCSGIYANIEGCWGCGKMHHFIYGNRYIREWEISALLGYQLASSCRCWTFTPFIGFDFFNQHHSFSGRGMKYRYHVYRIPIGFKWDYAFSQNWQLGIKFSVMPQVGCKLFIMDWKHFCFNLRKRTDWNFEMPLRYTPACLPECSIVFAPFVKSFSHGRSNLDRKRNICFPSQCWEACGFYAELCYNF